MLTDGVPEVIAAELRRIADSIDQARARGAAQDDRIDLLVGRVFDALERTAEAVREMTRADQSVADELHRLSPWVQRGVTVAEAEAATARERGAWGAWLRGQGERIDWRWIAILALGAANLLPMDWRAALLPWVQP